MIGMTKKEEKRIFEEACDGFGFEPIEQTVDGLYCQGCLRVHKRPTKMYSNGQKGLGSCLCRHQVVFLFNPEDQ